MAGPEQNQDLQKIAAEQGKLESARNATDSPEALKAKLAEYKATYLNALNAGKTDLENSANTFKSKDAKEYLQTSASSLYIQINLLADEGQKIYGNEKVPAPAPGEKPADKPVDKSAAKKEYPTLSSLKQKLAAELSSEKTNLDAIRKLEIYRTNVDTYSDSNDKVDAASTTANLSGTLAQKQSLLKSLEATSKSVEAVKGEGLTTAASIKIDLQDKIKALKSDLGDDIEIANNLVTGQAELKKQNTAITALDTTISGKKEKLSQADYDSTLAQLKSQSTNLSTLYADKGPGYIHGMKAPFLEKINTDYYAKIFQPTSDKLQGLYDKLEKLHPNGQVAEDPEKQANLNAVAAKAEFVKQNAELTSIEKAMAADSKDEKKNLDPDLFKKIQDRLATVSSNIEKLNTKYNFAVLSTDANPNIATIGKELYDQHYEPALAHLKTVNDLADNRKSAIETFQIKTFNDELDKSLDSVDKNWQANINNQKKFLAQAPNLDENSPEFKAHLDGETKIFNFLVGTESQINFVLSKDTAKSGMNSKNQNRCNEYRNLCKTYLDQITANRAYRGIQKEAGKQVDQEYSYKVKIGTREVTKYRTRPGRGGPITTSYTETEDILEDHQDNYKFADCVQFIDPNDPNYKTINDGKGWKFTKDLPEEVRNKMTVQAALIITEQKKSAEDQTLKDKTKVLVDNKLFDKAREGLKPEGENYFAAVEAMSAGKMEDAIKLFQQYIASESTLSEDQKKQHEPYLADAKRQVEVYNSSAEFYAAMKLMKDGKLDDALPQFRAYIEKIQKLPEADQKKFAEQLGTAIEVMRKINTAKVSMLDDLNKDLKFAAAYDLIKSNFHTVDPKNFASLTGTPRLLMIPYVSPDLLTDADRKQLAEGRAGMQGPESTQLDNAIKDLRKRIDKGEPLDFDAEYKKIKAGLTHFSDPKESPGAGTYTAPDGSTKVDCPSARLSDLFDKINSTDKATREKGFVTVADYFKDQELGMKYTQKYLGKAMFYRYQEFEETDGGATGKEIRDRMLKDSKIGADVVKGAEEIYKKQIEEANSKLPKDQQIALSPPDPLVFQRIQAQIFESQFKFQYEREMRKKMTDQGMAKDGDSALARMNTSLPYEDGTGRWYKPWSWSNYNEDEWNDFKDKTREFVVTTIVTLPIGMGAGAIGKMVGQAGLRLLFAEGVSDLAITALEQGGVRAVLSNPALYEGLSPAMRVAFKAGAGAAWGTGVVAEGGAMLLMNSAWEGLSTGKNPEFFEYLDQGKWSKASVSFLESIAKVGAFRAIGASQQAIGKAILGEGEATLTKKIINTVATEAFSGFAGTSIEAFSMGIKGHGDQADFDFWMKSLAQNALQSYGTHLAHGPSEKAPARDKTLERKFETVDREINTERLGELGVKKPADIGEVRVNAQGEVFVNGKKLDTSSSGINIEKLPPAIKEPLQAKIVEAKVTEGKAQMKSKFDSAGVVDPNDIVALNNGKMVTKKGVEIPITDPQHLPENFQPRVEELRRAEVKRKVAELKPLESLLYQRIQLEKITKADPNNQTAKDKLAEIDSKLEATAKERGITKEKLVEQIVVESRLYKSLDALYTGEQSLYHESKVVKKPVLDEKGQPRLGPDNKPLYEDVNLFKNYETKTSAYSTELLKSLDYATLVREGGFKLIKIGGDELVLYHAGPDGTVQKLFIDISNMGPTNDTAVNIKGSRVNLVDIYLFKISEHIKAQSESHQGKALDPVEFMKGIDRISKELFALDRGPNGEKIPYAEVEAKFNKLKAEWNLDGTYADYLKAVSSLRIMAEYRADTRSLDASYKENKGVTFDQHVTSEIEKISGMSLADIQKLIADHRDDFARAMTGRIPTSEKLFTRNEQGEIISGPPLTVDLIDHILALKPGAKAQDLMPLYNMLARLDSSKFIDPALKPLTDTLQKTRGEMIGSPAHPRIEQPRIMDAKVVSIDLPPEITKALQQMDPVQAQAILTAARTLAEHPLDSLKYSKSPEFAKFNILDHVELVEGKIVIKKEATEFKKSYEENLQDKKVSNIAEVEKSLQAAKATAEKLQSDYQQGKVSLDQFKVKIREIEGQISKLEDRLSLDPDTGAYSQAYLDLKPSRLFSFPGGDVLPQNRIWHSVTTELGHAGAINSKYGYANMDAMMKAYHDVLKSAISAELPANLAHFKIIRSGGGKFEVIFLDARSVEALAKKGLTPDSLVQKIAEGPGQKAIDAQMAKAPAAKAATDSDAAVRNSLFEYVKGNQPIEPGKLTVTTQEPITSAELTKVLAANPGASGRELLSGVMRERSINKAVELGRFRLEGGSLDPAQITGVEGNKIKLQDGTVIPIEKGKLPLHYRDQLEKISPGSFETFSLPITKLTDLPPSPITRNEAPRPINEVPRATEILAVGDLHGNGEIFVANLQSLKIVGPDADFHNPETMKWTGGDRKIVFHGDILGDRGTQSLEIMASIRKLQAEARAAGGDITILAGNHEDWAISFITGKELPGGGMDAFNSSLYGKEQGKGILEFIQKFSGDPRFANAKTLEEVAKIAGFEVENIMGNKLVMDKKFPAYLKDLQQKILTNMRKSPEGRVILEQMASLKVGEYIDDTLFFHTDPSQAMVDLINKNGKTVGEGIDAINKKYQQGLRYLLLGEGTMPADFQAISDAFTDTSNRSGEKAYQEVKLDSLKAKGVNRIIHGHSDYDGKIINKDGIDVTSVDYSAGKKGTNMEGRSVALISKDQGTLSTGTDVEPLIQPKEPPAKPEPKKPEPPKPDESGFSEEQLKIPENADAAREQIYADARNFLGPVSEFLIKANNRLAIVQMLEAKPEYRALAKRRAEIKRQRDMEVVAKDLSPQQKSVLDLFPDRTDLLATSEKIQALPPEIIDLLLKTPLSKEYREKLLYKEYLQPSGTDQIIISGSTSLGKTALSEVTRGVILTKNESGQYVSREVAIKKPTDSTSFARDLASNAEVAGYAKADGLLKPIFAGTAKDGFGTEQPVIITELVVPKPEYGKPDLSAVMVKENNPSIVVDYLEQSIIGLETIHENGSIHLDFKPRQVMVGTMGEKSGAFLGDFAFIKAEDLPFLKIEGNQMTIKGVQKIVYQVVDTRTNTVIPTTPSFIEAFRGHLQKSIDYAKAHLGEKIPQNILELPDRGAFAQSIKAYVELKGGSAETPQAKKLFEELTALSKRLGNPEDPMTLSQARQRLREISAEYRGEKPEPFAKAKEYDPSKIPDGTVLSDGTIYHGTKVIGGLEVYLYSDPTSPGKINEAMAYELPNKLQGTKYENPDIIVVEKIYNDLLIGTDKFDPGNPEQMAALKIKLKPEDFTVLQNNLDLPPEVLSAVIQGGQEFAPGLRVYYGKFLGSGGYGSVAEMHYVEASTGKIKTGVIKTPHPTPDAKANFGFEVNTAREVMAISKSDPKAAHLIKPIFVSDQAIIYEKASDAKGNTTDLEKSMKTTPTGEWLKQFAGGLDGLIYMHENGIAHDDFKPANIVTGPQGGVLIDIGSKVSAADIASGKVKVMPFKAGGQPLAHYVTRDGTGAEKAYWVPQDEKYNNAYLLTDVVAGRLPLDVPDKFAVGKSIASFLEKKGLADANGNLAPNVPPEVAELRNLASLLLSSPQHPYQNKGNNPTAGVDTLYISLATVSNRIKYIANKL